LLHTLDASYVKFKVTIKPTGHILSVAFAPDGHTVATGEVLGNIRLWRVSDGTLLRIFKRPTYPVGATINSLAFAPDGQTLASGLTQTGVTCGDPSGITVASCAICFSCADVHAK
jgi:WD40 repeat protein